MEALVAPIISGVLVGVIVAIINHVLGGSKSTQETLTDIRERLGKIEGKEGLCRKDCPQYAK